MYHKYVKKTKNEIAKQKAEHAAKSRLKQQRREEQEKNVAAKQADENLGSKESEGWDDEADFNEVTNSEDETEVSTLSIPAKKRKLLAR